MNTKQEDDFVFSLVCAKKSNSENERQLKAVIDCVCTRLCWKKKNKTERNGCSGKCVQHGLSVLQEGELGKCEAVMMCCVVHSSRSAFLVSPG